MSDNQLDRIRRRVMEGGLVISAGAGTGKTYTLIESYLAAVDKMKANSVQRIYDRILAITFTNAATYEFKKRIEGKVVSNQIEFESYLTSQEISTIHSACQRMLQNLALEVGLNPSTDILERGDDFNLASEVLESKVQLALSSGDSGVTDLLTRYDLRGSEYQEGLRDLLFSFHSKTRTLGWSIETTLKTCNEALQALEETLKLPDDQLTKWLEANSISNASESGTARLVLNEVVKVSREFLTLYGQYATEFDRRKRTRGLVSHDDSLYYANEALQNLPNKEPIREYYRSKYDLILVDEYQDTDPLQERIIEQISNTDRIYRVGDAKQSIFRFRRADPKIFQKQVLASDPSKGEIESLTESRRSRTELVNFTNYLFSQIFNSDFLSGNGLGDVAFEPLKALRRRASGEEELDKQDPVEVYRIREGGIRDMCADEAHFIANRILQLTGRACVYRRGEGDAPPSVAACEFKDIAMLFRTKTHLDLYLGELTRNSIPYIIAEAPGLFDQPEIGLLVGFLRFLNEPNDRLMQATLLRSPVFCVSDVTLTRLARNSFRLNPEFIAGVANDADKAALNRFLEMNRVLQNAKSLPKRDLIQEILRRTDLDLINLTKVNGSQAYANLMRILELASSFDKDVNGSLDAFLNWIENLEQTTEQSQAQVYDEASNAVKIFTIHKAKGLEFPIVFVPMMFRRFKDFPSDFYVSENSELDLPRKGQTVIPFLLKPGDTGLVGANQRAIASLIDRLFGKLTGTESSEDACEEWRLLYVAITRASDVLIFSLCSELASKTIKKYTNSAGKIDLRSIAMKNWNARVVMLVTPPNAEPKPPREIARITWHDHTPEVDRPELSTKRKEIPPTRSIEQTQFLPRLSATDFADYEYCARRYYYARVLGLRHYERHTGLEEEERSSQELGSKLHEMLEAYNFVDKNLPKTPRLTDEEREKLMPLVEAIANSELGAKIANTREDGQRREFEFSTMIDDVQFISRIDLALKDDKGDWSIFDYKSGKRTDWSLELYKKQVSFYASLFGYAMKVPTTGCSIVYAGAPYPDIVPFKPDVTIERIKQVVHEIEKSNSEGNFKAEDDPQKCNACPYSGSGKTRWVCRVGAEHIWKMKDASE